MSKIFGSTVNETLIAFKPIHLGSSNSKKKDKAIAFARIIISVILIFAATALAFNKETKEIGTGIFGTVLGYWLK